MVRVRLAESPRKTKKFEARVYDERDGKSRSVHFGATGYSDYTKHLDGERKRRYLTRHGADRSRQDWTKRGILTPGFWARWLLWEEKTMEGAKKKISKRFGIKFV